VRVAQAEWGDGLITTSNPQSANPAQALADLYKAGCNVAVIVHEKDDGTSILDDPDAQQTRATLCNAKVPVRSIPLMHDKIAIAGPSYGGNANNWNVMMGSTNTSKNALRTNDELLVRVRYSQQLFDLYNTHWWEEWAYGHNVCNALPTG
jgi:phosphatidylserine/phosphatidylglycerophosphate/cardiolipin synthase-like enzyme